MKPGARDKSCRQEWKGQKIRQHKRGLVDHYGISVYHKMILYNELRVFNMSAGRIINDIRVHVCVNNHHHTIKYRLMAFNLTSL